jgi:uncharacterized protein YjdB|tara:strand:- start:10 stop:327 length:318 start_codon:yes stop_codon:yes gene_type:complete
MSSLRVTSLKGRTGTQSPTLPDGAVITGVTTISSAIVGVAVTINSTGVHAGTGIITATSFSGSASGLTAVPSAQLTGALPALDGSALTNLNIPTGFNELDAALFN